MNDRIVCTDATGTTGRMISGDREVSGPLPPLAGDLRSIYDRMIAGGVVPEPWVEPAPPVPAAISDRQFAQALAMGGVITEGEALAWAARGDLPDALETAIGSIPEDARFAARMLLSSATTYERDHPLVAALGTMLGYGSAALDDLWRMGASL